MQLRMVRYRVYPIVDRRGAGRHAGRASVMLLSAIAVLACGHPRVYVWVDNRSTSDLLFRYEQSAGNRVYEVPAGASGFVGSFPGPESQNDIVVLTQQCEPFGPPLPVPEVGGVTVTIADDDPSISEVPVPVDIDPPAVTRVARCGDAQEP